MAQFAIDEILTTGIQISGFVFDVSNNIGANGYVLTSTSSGVMWQQDSSNADLASLSGQIAATGTLLNNRINSLSGYSNANFATILNLAATGSTLDTKINTTNTNLAATGSTLDTKINTLSGYSNSTFATITNLAATGSTLNARINSLSGYITTGAVENNRIYRECGFASLLVSTSGWYKIAQYEQLNSDFIYDLMYGEISYVYGDNLQSGNALVNFNAYFRQVNNLASGQPFATYSYELRTSETFKSFEPFRIVKTIDTGVGPKTYELQVSPIGNNYGLISWDIKHTSTSTNSRLTVYGTEQVAGNIIDDPRVSRFGNKIFTDEVGIGIFDPLSLLSVGGSGSTTALSGITFGGDSSVNLYRSSAGALKTDGSLGIGINPVQKLQVEGTVGDPASIAATQSGIFRISNTTNNVVLDFGIRAGGVGAWIQSTDETALNNNYPLLLNPNGGSVGIGITSPSGQLHLRNMGFTSQSAIPDSNIFPNATGVFGLVMDHNTYTNGQYRHRFVKVDRSSNLPLYLQQAGGVANQYINLVRFGTHSQSTNTFEVFGDSKINGTADITSNLLVSGNAGFGTANPTYQLTVIGANQATANLTDAGAKGGSILVGSSVNAVDQGGAVLFATKNDANLYTPQFAIKSLFQNGMGSGIGDLAFSSRLLTGDSALTEVLRIKNDGKVGIGTNNPFTKLHVYAASNGNNWAWFAGNVGATVPSQFTYGLLLGTNYSNGFSESNLVWGHGISSNQYFAIGKASGNASYTEQLRIDRNGNVGIGTNVTPLKLNVSGSIYMAAGSGSAISWANDISSQFLKYDSVTDGMVLSSWSHTTFLTQQTERARIASNGNVGIGVTNPTTLLQLKGDAGSHQIFSINRSGSTTPAVYIGTDGNQNALIASNNTNLLFGKDFVGTFNEYARISSNGNFGIGTSNPNAKLHIENSGTVSSIATVRLVGSTGNNAGSQIEFYKAQNPKASIGLASAVTGGLSDDLLLLSTNPNSIVLAAGLSGLATFKPDGKVGIGIYNPISLLSVGGAGSTSAASGLTFGQDAQANLYRSAEDTIKTDGSLVVAANATFAGNVGIGLTNPAVKLDVSGGNARFSDYIIVGEDLAYPSNTGSAYLGYSPHTASSPQSNLELIDALSNAIGVNDPLRFRNVISGQYFSGSQWYEDPSPLSYRNLLNGNVNSSLDLVTSSEYSVGISGKRFVVDQGANYTRPNFILLSTDWNQNWWGFKLNVEHGNDLINWTGCISEQTFTTNNTKGTIALSISTALGGGISRYFRFSFVANQAITAGSLRVNKIRSLGNQNYSSTIPVSTSSTGHLIASVGIISPTITSLSGNLAATGSVLDTKINTLSGYSNSTFATILNLAATGSTLNARINSLSGYAGSTFLSGQGTANWVSRWNGTKELITGSIYDLGTGVGIGTTNPVALLTVGSTTTTSSEITLQGEYQSSVFNNSNIFNFRHGGFDRWRLLTTQNSAASNDFDFSINAINATVNAYNTFLTIKGLNGNVGIGTTNPATLLHVNTAGADARIRVSAGANTVQGGMIANTGTSLIYAGSVTNHGFSLRTNDTDRVRIDTNGNVGVSTTSMVGKLDVYDNTDGPLLSFVRNASAGSSAYSAFVLRRDGNNNGIVLFTNSSARSTDGGAGNSTIRTDYGNLNFGAGGSQHILTTAGNVGINNTSPSSKLHVVETTPTGTRIQLGTNTENASMNAGLTNDLLILNAPYGTNSATVSNSGAKWGIKFIGTLEANQFNSTSKTSAIYAVSEDPTAGYNRGTSLAFYTNSWFDQEYTERMRIFHNGNIGIGTTQPSYKLQIVGSGTPTSPTVLQVAGLNNDGGDAKLIVSQNPGASDLQLLVAGTDTRSDGFNANDQYILAGQQLNLFNRGNGTTYNTQIIIGRDGGYGNISFSTAPQNQTAVVRMYIASGGNVGIGSISPACKLDVAGTIRSSTNEIYGFGASDNVSLRAASTSNVLGIYTSNVERLRLAANGYFGIGTDNPSTLLSIGRAGSTTAASGITFGEDAQANLYRTAEDTLRTDGALIAGTYLRALNYVQLLTNLFPDSYTDYLKLNVGNAAGNAWENYPVVIKRGVYVGIGTDTPSGKLHVVSTVAGETVLRADGTNGTLFSVVDDLSDSLMSVNNSAGLPVLEVFADDRVVAGQYGSGDFVIRNNKVGIGATNPLNKLSVIGAASIGSTSYNIAAPTNGLLVEGNVGIGTTNPAGTYGKLVVAGGIRTLDDNNSKLELGRYSAGASNSYIKLGSNSNSLRITNNTDAADIFTILNGGNVGLGSTNPTGKLDVVGNVVINGASNSNVSQLALTRTDVSWGIFNETDLRFYSANSNTSTPSTFRMAVTSAGNVGIGVTNPSQLLHISSAATAKLKITADTDNVDENDLGGIEISQDGGVTTSYFGHDNTNSLILGVNSTTTPNIYIGTRNDGTNFVTSADAKVTILNGGNVGIGTADPQYKLDVYSTNQDVARFYNNQATFGLILGSTSNSSFTNLLWQTSGGNAQFFKNASSASWGGTNSMNLYTSNGGIAFHPAGTQNAVFFNTNGNIGINTITPAHKLEVVNTANYQTYVRVNNQSSGAAAYAGLDLQSYGGGWQVRVPASTVFQNPLLFSFNEVEKAVLTYDGKLGIGITNPTDKIHISGGGISFTSSTGLAIPMLGVTATNVAYVGPYTTTAEGVSPSLVLFNQGASVQQTWFYSSGRVAMVLNKEGRLHIGNTNNTPNCLLSVGPSSSTTAVSGMCFGNDAQANLYRSAEDTIKTDGNLVVAGTTSLNGHIYGQKTVALSTASWTTVLTVNMLSHNSCYVKIGAFGDWSNHSAIAFVSELFIQNGDNAFNTPGTIITAHDNTAGAAGDKVDIQIVDPAAAGTQNFLIQLKLISATSSTNSSLITYHVMGQQASVT